MSPGVVGGGRDLPRHRLLAELCVEYDGLSRRRIRADADREPGQGRGELHDHRGYRE